MVCQVSKLVQRPLCAEFLGAVKISPNDTYFLEKNIKGIEGGVYVINFVI